MLRNQGYSVGALHGDMSQNARLEALENFKSGKTGLMVATDVAARGLDIPNVGAVVNYTFPLTIEDYIHRIGRTGGFLFTMDRYQGSKSTQVEAERMVDPSHFSLEMYTRRRSQESLRDCLEREALTTKH